MDREKIIDLIGEYDNLTAVFYMGDEIPAMHHMDILSVEDYDDEIVVRGTGSDYVILTGNPKVKEDPYGDTEYIFGTGNYRIGIILL
jgi:hypothetical protein